MAEELHDPAVQLVLQCRWVQEARLEVCPFVPGPDESIALEMRAHWFTVHSSITDSDNCALAEPMT